MNRSSTRIFYRCVLRSCSFVVFFEYSEYSMMNRLSCKNSNGRTIVHSEMCDCSCSTAICIVYTKLYFTLITLKNKIMMMIHRNWLRNTISYSLLATWRRLVSASYLSSNLCERIKVRCQPRVRCARACPPPWGAGVCVHWRGNVMSFLCGASRKVWS